MKTVQDNKTDFFRAALITKFADPIIFLSSDDTKLYFSGMLDISNHLVIWELDISSETFQIATLTSIDKLYAFVYLGGIQFIGVSMKKTTQTLEIYNIKYSYDTSTPIWWKRIEWSGATCQSGQAGAILNTDSTTLYAIMPFGVTPVLVFATIQVSDGAFSSV